MIPVALTIDRSQNLYIADGSGRIRVTKVSACFFTLSKPVASISSSGGTRTLTVAATNSSCPYTLSSDSLFVTITSGASGTGNGTLTFSVAANTGVSRTATVSVGGASFTVNQAAPSAQYNVGFFQPTNGPLWLLDSNGSGKYDAGDKNFVFGGQAGAIAVVGDWSGDGHSKVGYYLNGFWFLDHNGNGVYDAGDKVFGFGAPDPRYVPITGDWNGDGKTKIGIFRNGFWILDFNGNGGYDAGDRAIPFGGTPGNQPIIDRW